jgi:hypothetical protein
MARVLSADWHRLYAHPIYFLETFIDPQRFHGTCYRAANWTVLGVTTGRGKADMTHQANRSIKQVLGYPLVISPALSQAGTPALRRHPQGRRGF